MEELVVRDEGESEEWPWGRSLICKYRTVDRAVSAVQDQSDSMEDWMPTRWLIPADSKTT